MGIEAFAAERCRGLGCAAVIPAWPHLPGLTGILTDGADAQSHSCRMLSWWFPKAELLELVFAHSPVNWIPLK